LILFTQNTSTIRYAPFLVFKERDSLLPSVFNDLKGTREKKLPLQVRGYYRHSPKTLQLYFIHLE